MNEQTQTATPAAEVIQIPGIELFAARIDAQPIAGPDVFPSAKDAWFAIWKQAAEAKNQAAYDLADAKLVELGMFAINIWGPVVL